MNKELKPEFYGAWKIRIQKISGGHAIPQFRYLVELYDTEISNGWITVRAERKKSVFAVAIEDINRNYKRTTRLNEHGVVLRMKDDQFRGVHWG